MPKAIAEYLGILPSLEVVPLFADGLHDQDGTGGSPFQLRAFSSYGEIARSMLTRQITGGIVPWEIFVADVLALPGQRNCWKVTMFIHACPTELVLRERVFKAFYPAKSGSRVKLPARLTFGVESRNSLTKSQSLEWLGHWKGGTSIELSFRMLPMDLMIQALEADALDAIIAPSPWGIHAEAAGLGRRDPRFVPGKFAQQLVMVCHKDIHDRHPDLTQVVSRNIAAARTQLLEVSAFRRAIAKMSGSGKPLVRSGIFEQAASLHAFPTLNQDAVPDIRKLVEELMSLDDASSLPAQVAPSEQTARLLLPN